MKRPPSLSPLMIFPIALLLIPVVFLGFALYAEMTVTSKSALERNWGIVVPEEFEEIFHASEPSFHGDGYRYTVFSASQNSDFTAGFSKQQNQEIELFVGDSVQKLSVPTEVIPNMKYGYIWRKFERENDGSAIVMLYSPRSQMLYIAERFI